jgi:hypothetical protein
VGTGNGLTVAEVGDAVLCECDAAEGARVRTADRSVLLRSLRVEVNAEADAADRAAGDGADKAAEQNAADAADPAATAGRPTTVSATPDGCQGTNPQEGAEEASSSGTPSSGETILAWRML